ncbi:hypothetical protein HOK00_07790, partial [bacterium]|nr:hypothetical protein [bacterium]
KYELKNGIEKLKNIKKFSLIPNNSDSDNNYGGTLIQNIYNSDSVQLESPDNSNSSINLKSTDMDSLENSYLLSENNYSLSENNLSLKSKSLKKKDYCDSSDSNMINTFNYKKNKLKTLNNISKTNNTKTSNIISKTNNIIKDKDQSSNKEYIIIFMIGIFIIFLLDFVFTSKIS